MSNFIKHLPWVAPTVAILAVGSGFLDRINISFDGAEEPVAEVAPVAPAAPVVLPEPVVVAAAAEPAPEPANVAEQLAALLEATNADTNTVEVTRNQGFSLGTLEEATDVALDAAPQGDDGAVGADFFAAAQANLARDRRCVDDLQALSSQARVYFPSGGVTADQAGIEQARLLGILAQQCPGVRIVVEGHSDPSGNPIINQELSLERAQAVITRVAAAGVDATLFTPIGRGSAEPSLVRGPQPDAYYDRRVEFSVEEVAQAASFVTPTFGAPTGAVHTAVCVQQLQAATQTASIEYAPRGMTITDADLQLASNLARIASACPQARLRLVGQHSANPQAGEDPSIGRLRAGVLMSRLVSAGFPSEQLVLGAPGFAQPMAGRSDSRVDFDIILEDF